MDVHMPHRATGVVGLLAMHICVYMYVHVYTYVHVVDVCICLSPKVYFLLVVMVLLAMPLFCFSLKRLDEVCQSLIRPSR